MTLAKVRRVEPPDAVHRAKEQQPKAGTQRSAVEIRSSATDAAVNSFRPIHRHAGYLPIADHALIGDGHASALVGRDATISWMCVPRFDDAPLFCGLLDRQRGGVFRLFSEVGEASQRYLDDSAVVVTTLRTPTGVCEVTDTFLLHRGACLDHAPGPGIGALLRRVHVISGNIELAVEVNPRGAADLRRHSGGWWVLAHAFPGLDLHLRIEPTDVELDSTLPAGRRIGVILGWATGSRRAVPPDHERLLEDTIGAWRRWAKDISYGGPQQRLVRRSAITLKLLDYFPNGAIVAAPTSSLPEVIGGQRNWDYRYTWVRDAAFTVYALRRIGLEIESERFLAWVLDAVERDGVPRVMYDLDGRSVPDEKIDPILKGYRASAPVRWGNAAARQSQHDVYGEILDCAYQWAARGGPIGRPLWTRLAGLADVASHRAGEPDHGIWEIRTTGRPFTYSVAMCEVALDRAARLSDRFGLPGDVTRWKKDADRLRELILTHAWDDQMQALTESLGPGGGLDASLLSLPLRRVIPAYHPRMVSTTRAIADRLSAGDGLLHRYLPKESPDGLPGHEGAFLLCSFWLVDNLAGQGRLDEAMQLYDSLCARGGTLGLLPEEIDPADGSYLGNYPQAFSHVGVISSGVNLSRRLAKGLKRPGFGRDLVHWESAVSIGRC